MSHFSTLSLVSANQYSLWFPWISKVHNSSSVLNDCRRRAAVLGRQMVASAGSVSDGRPTHWTPMPEGIDYKRVPLPSISEGYKKAEKKFLETMEGHPNIVSIEQVQNTDLWTLYTQ